MSEAYVYDPARGWLTSVTGTLPGGDAAFRAAYDRSVTGRIFRAGTLFPHSPVNGTSHVEARDAPWKCGDIAREGPSLPIANLPNPRKHGINYRNKGKSRAIQGWVAETKGFEPSRPFRGLRP